MSRVGRPRWTALMQSLGIGPQDAMLATIRAAYSEPHRRYHTLEHLDACLGELDSAYARAQAPAEVEVALWFHDAVYQPGASDNERRSAALAAQFLASAGAPQALCRRVYAHVMATIHGAPAATPDSSLVADIDLSILGKNQRTYDRFERAVRAEHQEIPWERYRCRRQEILRAFLERPFIYATEPFRQRYEQTARANLARAIGMLEAGGAAAAGQ